MEGKLIIPIEADITQFKAAFAEANKIVSDFNAQLGRSGSVSNLFSDNSIGVLITRISELEIQVSKLKKQFDDLKKSGTDSFEKVGNSASNAGKNIDVSKPINKTIDAAAKGRQTLTAFSLVAQDLPFGFIAIQNNLPNLIQYFGELKSQAGSTGGAFKQLGSALLGAGGIYFAFSAITATISYAIKEYGSLGNAIDALFGKLDPLYKVINRAKDSFDEYNKSAITAGEATAQAFGKAQGDIVKVETLSNAVLNLSNSEEIRKKALSQLQTIDKERFKSFDVEKGKLEGLKSATEEYTNAVIANGVAQQFQIQAISAATNYETQLNTFNQLLANLKEQERLYPGIAQAATDYGKAINDYNNQIAKGIFVSPPEMPKQFKDVLSSYITLNSKVKEFGKNVEVANAEVERTKKLYQDAINTANKYWRIPTEETKKIKPVKIIEINEASINSYKNLFDVLKMRQEERNNLLKEEKKLITDNYKLPNINPSDIKSNQILSFDIQIKTDKFIEDLEKTKKKLEETKNFFSDMFFSPLEDAFVELFNTGKFNFQQLGKAILDSLKQMLAKVLASGIIAILATLVTGGFGGAGGFAKGIKTVGGMVASSLGFSSGKVAAPDFSGMQGGGMQLAGEVVFVQRGSDLVGVINRTNGTINRVG